MWATVARASSLEPRRGATSQTEQSIAVEAATPQGLRASTTHPTPVRRGCGSSSVQGWGVVGSLLCCAVLCLLVLAEPVLPGLRLDVRPLQPIASLKHPPRTG